MSTTAAPSGGGPPPPIDWPDSFLILGTVLLAVTLVLLVIVVPVFVYFRNEPVLRHRNMVLEFIYWVTVTTMTIRFWYIILNIDKNTPYTTCAGIVWMVGLHAPAFGLSILIRCIRLYLIFYSTKAKLADEVNGDNDEKKPKYFWLDPKWITTPYLVGVYFTLIAAFQIFPAITTIIFFSEFGGITRAACRGNPAARYSAIASIVSSVLLIAFIAFKLRKVHDGYFIKKELKYLGIAGIIVILPAFVWSFIDPWGWHASIFSMTVLTIISFVIPGFLAMRSYYEKTMSGNTSLSGTTGEESEMSVSTSQIEKPQYPKFKGHSKVAKFLADNRGLAYLERYLLHFQEIDMGNTLLLWSNIQKFKEIKEETSLVAKAYLLVQKFIAPGSYIYVDCISSDQRDYLIRTVTEAMNLVTGDSVALNVEGGSATKSEAKVTTDFFDGVLETLEDTLSDRLFSPFFKSEFYKEYQEKEVALSKGLLG